jgi:RimJ/RimL family protein N-acetyltransferase/methionyl-tRNA formyltransferase
MTIRVAFLGSRPFGHFVLNALCHNENVEIVACVTKEPGEKAWWHLDPHQINAAPVMTCEDLASVDFDLAISANYWKIISPEMIAKPRLGFINTHHSYALSIRGTNITTHAILDARKYNRWFHGTTLHYINEDLDKGPIIASDMCPITEQDTAGSLFAQIETLARRQFLNWLPIITTARPAVSYPEDNHPIYPRSALPDKNIKNLSDPLTVYDLVRALEFPGHEPAYTMKNDQKNYLTVSSQFGERIFIDAGDGRVVFQAGPDFSIVPHTPHERGQYDNGTDRLIIRLMEKRDLEELRLLHNEEMTLYRLTDIQHVSELQQNAWFDSMSASKSSRRYIARRRDTGDLVGIFRIDHLDFINRNCFVGCDIAPKHRGQGFATEFYRYILNYLFEQMGLHRVHLVALKENGPALNLYHKLGFKDEGLSRETIYRNGNWQDLISMGLLKSEWQSKK